MSGDQRYRRSVPDRRHSYEDFPTTRHVLSRVVGGPSEDEFVDRIVDILHDRDYWDQDEHKRKKAVRRAREIYGKLGTDPDSLTSGELEVVEDALDEGVLSDLRLDEAWHPHNFLSDEEAATYPYQHPTTVLYTGQNKRLFFSKPGKIDVKKYKQENGYGDYKEFTNPESIFDQGYVARSDTDKTTSINDAVFFTFDYRHAAVDRYGGSSFQDLYEASVVFEVEVPSSWITICKNPTGNSERFRDLNELHEKYGSPEEFRKRVVKGDTETEEKIQFELENSGLPLNMITGVWDLERSDDPIFYTLEEYHRLILSDFPFRVSWRCENVPWSIEASEVNRIREKKLEEKGVKHGLKLLQDISNKTKEIISILGVSGDGLMDSCEYRKIEWVETRLGNIPWGCPSCGNIFRQDQRYCDDCGADKKGGEFFKPLNSLRRLDRELEDLEELIDPPKDWEEKAKRVIEDGEEVMAKELSLPWEVFSELSHGGYSDNFTLYEHSLRKYASEILRISEEESRRAERLKKDLKKCAEDLEELGD